MVSAVISIQCLLPAKRPEGHGFETWPGNNREVRPDGADDPASRGDFRPWAISLASLLITWKLNRVR